MKRETYACIERYMLACMDPGDHAHGPEHVYRVLNAALDIAAHEENVDTDALICACLLHDVGRRAQAENPELCHAAHGAGMARSFLTERGFSEAFAGHVADCIRAHRYRGGSSFGSLEAKILYDADKLDVTGAIGAARTLIYGGMFDEPICSRGEDGEILDGTQHTGKHSFMHEYHFKLSKIYDGFQTARGAEIARARRSAAESFYRSLLSELRDADRTGKSLLNGLLED